MRICEENEIEAYVKYTAFDKEQTKAMEGPNRSIGEYDVRRRIGRVDLRCESTSCLSSAMKQNRNQTVGMKPSNACNCVQIVIAARFKKLARREKTRKASQFR